jgi:hypothetical protein
LFWLSAIVDIEGCNMMSIESKINLWMLAIAAVSAIIAMTSLYFTYKQWQKIKKKIVMINTSGNAMEILPLWYISRMMPTDLGDGCLGRDYWPFGLLMSDGRTIVIPGIESFSDDEKWIDVELAISDEWSIEKGQHYIFAIAKDRTSASIQVTHIIAAIELASS